MGKLSADRMTRAWEREYTPPSPFCPSSVHGRNREARPILDARRPAGGHGLGAGVEADRIRPMLVEIAEPRALPAAESIVGDRHRDRHVDADHADLDLAGEVARRVAVAGEYGDAVAVFVVVAQSQSLAVIMGADDRQNRAEDLFLVDPHVLRHMIEETPADIEAVLVALHPEVAPVDHQLRAFANAEVDIAAHLVQRRFGDERAEIRAGVGRRSDL